MAEVQAVKVREVVMTECLAGKNVAYRIGQKHKFPEHQAARLVKRGQAIYAEEAETAQADGARTLAQLAAQYPELAPDLNAMITKLNGGEKRGGGPNAGGGVRRPAQA